MPCVVRDIVRVGILPVELGLIAIDAPHLTRKIFFLSTVVDQLQGFLSHRWRSNPQETADALMLHFKLRFFLIVLLALWAIGSCSS